jgi:hypothetical protein
MSSAMTRVLFLAFREGRDDDTLSSSHLPFAGDTLFSMGLHQIIFTI